MVITKNKLIEILDQLGVEEMDITIEVPELFIERRSEYLDGHQRGIKKILDTKEVVRVSIEAPINQQSTFVGIGNH